MIGVRSYFPMYRNPWPNGVSVEWTGYAWAPCFDVDAAELLADFHAGRTTARALTLGEFGADLALAKRTR